MSASAVRGRPVSRRVLLGLAQLSLLPWLGSGCSRGGAGAAVPGSAAADSDVAFGSGLKLVKAAPGIERLEREMFMRLNRDRKEHGLAALLYDPKLADVARFHASDMRDNHFFEHESPSSGSLVDRLNRAGYLFLAARENLAEAPDVQAGQNALLESPGHFANIMATDITHVGIGIVRGGVAAPENLTITQVFSTPGQAESAASARSSLIRAIQKKRSELGLGPAVQHSFLNSLAQEQLPKLDNDNSPSSLNAAGQRISEAAAATPHSGMHGVLVTSQLLPDSRSFEVPDALLAAKAAPFGLAVRSVPSANGRPMIQLLLLVGR